MTKKGNTCHFSTIFDHINTYTSLERRDESMCFFQDVFLSSSFILCLYWLYKTYVSKEMERKKIENYEWFLLGSFSLCLLFPSLVRFFFLDLFILLAYKEGKFIVGILLSFIFGFCFFGVDKFSIFWMLLLLVGYFSIFLFLPQKDRRTIKGVILFKAFITSLLLFQTTTNFLVPFLSLFFLLLIEYLFLLQFLPQIITIEDMENVMTELEKNLFKITHEIKNPIAVCKGYLDMMDPKDIEKTSKYLPIVKNEIARTLVIMEDFMSIRNVTIRPDIMDFYLLLEDIEDTVQFLLKEHGCFLEIPKGQEELFLFADYDRLKQVFVNLIKNSLEANATKVVVKAHVKNNKLVITVKDTGDGITEETLEHLGELFFTTKTLGTGVGVHLSEEIIRLHYGKMKYNSQVGHGTTVTITLPVMKEGGMEE